LLGQVQHALGSRSVVAAADAVATVLSASLLAVSSQDAQTFVAALPPTLRSLLHAAAFERAGAPVVLDRSEFVARVGRELRIDPPRAEQVAREVVRSAFVWLPRDALRALEQRLAPAVRDGWRVP
jgi:uncharacterized protein (DUF2267 family)